METVADESSLAGRQRALVNQRRFEPAPQIGAKIDPRFDRIEQIALPRGQPGLNRRQASQRPPEKTQVARRRPAGRHARQEPLHVVCLAERLLQVFSQGRVCHELFHGVEPRANRADLGQRAGDPLRQQARTHRSDGVVEDGQQGTLAAALADRS